MIELVNLNKAFGTGKRRKVVADNLSIAFPEGRSVALMGRNGAGKSTLLRMIAGTMNPDSGHVRRTGTISWPVGFKGSFHADLTGAQNTRFLARVYGVDTDELQRFVADFAELGHHFNLPFKSYSSGMRSRLAFGVSMGIRFDTYLIDEVTSVGDAAFKQKSSELLLDRLEESGAIVVSHGKGMMRRLCDCAMVLEKGQLVYYDDLEEAIEVHHKRLLG
ncbi:ABC transporter ATP-binding protein [Aliishimia ponticola]|uniref:ABC transporter ATP-binding protein n=1 Tax=Aliishimia ponticola TaxID=2499833 RepID=A0A4S4NEW2_9RHOB|nr:ABC transporter ATP-binding protein [Aliishimia ponticola]THH38049.1 ABC transporter ATP-binding protein [Aliishimia ponticola]